MKMQDAAGGNGSALPAINMQPEAAQVKQDSQCLCLHAYWYE